ncbi:MAG: SelT/SelW/SelH family protein [Bacteroidota bacterium]
MKPVITIEYCPKCGWLLRAAYMAQEILISFSDDIKAVSLQPSEQPGAYYIYINDDIVFNRKEYGGFPEIKIIKRIIRNIVNPEKNLGHIDMN